MRSDCRHALGQVLAHLTGRGLLDADPAEIASRRRPGPRAGRRGTAGHPRRRAAGHWGDRRHRAARCPGLSCAGRGRPRDGFPALSVTTCPILRRELRRRRGGHGLDSGRDPDRTGDHPRSPEAFRGGGDKPVAPRHRPTSSCTASPTGRSRSRFPPAPGSACGRRIWPRALPAPPRRNNGWPATSSPPGTSSASLMAAPRAAPDHRVRRGPPGRLPRTWPDTTSPSTGHGGGEGTRGPPLDGQQGGSRQATAVPPGDVVDLSCLFGKGVGHGARCRGSCRTTGPASDGCFAMSCRGKASSSPAGP